jgi:hypothetical protein
VQVLVEQLNDFSGAEAYCKEHFRDNDPKSRHVFDYLVKFSFSSSNVSAVQQISLLNNYGLYIDGRYVNLLI